MTSVHVTGFELLLFCASLAIALVYVVRTILGRKVQDHVAHGIGIGALVLGTLPDVLLGFRRATSHEAPRDVRTWDS